MAVSILFDINRFNRFLSVYEQSQTQFAGKVALTKFGKRIKGSQGLSHRDTKEFFKSLYLLHLIVHLLYKED